MLIGVYGPMLCPIWGFRYSKNMNRLLTSQRLRQHEKKTQLAKERDDRYRYVLGGAWSACMHCMLCPQFLYPVSCILYPLCTCTLLPRGTDHCDQ